MSLRTLPIVLSTAGLLMAGCLAEESDEVIGQSVLEEGGHGGGHHCEPGAVMQTGDFDGDGTITSADVNMLVAYKDAGDYAAFFDMNDDGVLDGRDVSMVARNMGSAGSARDAQMAQLWAAIEPFRDVRNAIAAGYVPFTPDLMGHGVHWANFDLIYSYNERGGFHPGQPEGLNYSADGELLAAFYYGPGAIDLYDYGQYPVADTAFLTFPAPNPTFAGVMPHTWHQHKGPCFGAATCPVPGFDQCMTEATCDSLGGQLWSPQFHMLHAWVVKRNAECGVFGGLNHEVSMSAPMEPNHGDCNLQDLVPVVVNEPGVAPMGFEANACYCDWPYGSGDADCE